MSKLQALLAIVTLGKQRNYHSMCFCNSWNNSFWSHSFFLRPLMWDLLTNVWSSYKSVTRRGNDGRSTYWMRISFTINIFHKLADILTICSHRKHIFLWKTCPKNNLAQSFDNVSSSCQNSMVISCIRSKMSYDQFL